MSILSAKTLFIFLLVCSWASSFALGEGADKDKKLHSQYVAGIFHDVGYEILNSPRVSDDDVKQAMVGLLEPTFKEIVLGQAAVRELFKVPKLGIIAGCLVTEGKVTRTAEVRLLRDNVVIHTGKVGSLRRFKDDVAEVKQSFECGIGIAGYNDLKQDDVIEFFEMVAVAVKSL